MKGVCASCGKKGDIERHHVLPRRFFGDGKGNKVFTLLCATHHRALEILIEDTEKARGIKDKKGHIIRERLTKEEYFELVDDFLYLE